MSLGVLQLPCVLSQPAQCRFRAGTFRCGNEPGEAIRGRFSLPQPFVVKLTTRELPIKQSSLPPGIEPVQEVELEEKVEPHITKPLHRLVQPGFNEVSTV